jgi:ankyrin repeat protein
MKNKRPTREVGSRIAERLLAAAEAGDLAGVRAALAEGADPSAKNRLRHTALMLAARISNDCVDVLLEAGACVRSKSLNQWTAAMSAAQGGQARALAKICRADNTMDDRDNEGWSALMIASRRGHLSCVEDLLSLGAAVDRTNKMKMTALMQAARGRESLCVAALLRGGADAEARDEKGKTALMYAAESGAVECMEVLLGMGASLDAMDDWGQTAEAWGAKGPRGGGDYLAALRERRELDVLVKTKTRGAGPRL